jgi:putative hydrolase of the HAD superfamily
VEQSPVMVMVGAAMEGVFSPNRIDAIFTGEARNQNEHELLFSIEGDFAYIGYADLEGNCGRERRGAACKQDEQEQHNRSQHQDFSGSRDSPRAGAAIAAHGAGAATTFRRRRMAPANSGAGTLEVVALDADDTLWHNETIFHAVQAQLHQMLSQYHDAEWIDQRLYETERRNLRYFGYGVKGFVLSMIETTIELTEERVSAAEIRRIVGWGRDMLQHPVELLDGVEETVNGLAEHFRLVLLTKGDLFDQESKLARSGLGECFSAVEIVSEKDTRTYAAVMARLAVEPARFVMVGNSLRSDVLPVLQAGGAAVHIPYQTTWVHEQVPDEALRGREFARLDSIRELPVWLGV